MRAAIFEGPGNIRVEDVPDPEVLLDTDAVVQVTDACICGWDLWAYRGYGRRQPGARIGHEFVGTVVDVGAEVRTVRKGDVVIAPSGFSCGRCEFCQRGLQSSCVDGGFFSEPGHDGGQGEALRVPHADGTLVVAPPSMRGSEQRLLPLTCVMAAGHHAALAARVNPRSTVAVLGDGAVGLCATLAARRLGATRVIAVGHHAERLTVAEDFGATDIVLAGGDESVEEIMTLTGGVDAVLECVGAQSSFGLAIAIAKPGATIGYVGTPHLVESVDMSLLFARNLSLRGGACPVRAYLPDLLADVLDGSLDASSVIDMTVGLDELDDGYAMMDDRMAVKVHVKP